MLSVQEVASKVERLKTRNMDRDRRMSDVLAVRQGRMQDVFYGQFSDEYPKPLIANMVDIAARDLAEVTAPLPAINCSSSNMSSDAARKRLRLALVLQHIMSTSQTYNFRCIKLLTGITPMALLLE